MKYGIGSLLLLACKMLHDIKSRVWKKKQIGKETLAKCKIKRGKTLQFDIFCLPLQRNKTTTNDKKDMAKIMKPVGYERVLDMRQTEQGIKLIKEFFQQNLSTELRLRRSTTI